MALADIVRRIGHDAGTEATELILKAEIEAEQTRAKAHAEAKTHFETELTHAKALAEEAARTRVAGARLRGRDRSLAEKRELIDRVMVDAVARIEALEDDRYATLIAREMKVTARDGEQVYISNADRERLRSSLPAALKAVGLDAEIADDESQTERGVTLEGDRMRVEISPASLVAAKRSELETKVAAALFEEEQ